MLNADTFNDSFVQLIIIIKGLLLFERGHFYSAFFFLYNQDVEVEKQSHFAIVNMKTATTAAVSVCLFS